MTIYDPAVRAQSRGAQVGIGLIRLSHTIRTMLADEAAVLGLTPTQAEALLFVRYTKPFLTSVGRLAEALGVTHATAVGIIDGLVRRGWMTRCTDARDRRVTLLNLTPDGEVVCQQLDQFGQRLEAALVHVDADALTMLERGLEALSQALQQTGYRVVVAEPCAGCHYFVENAAPDGPEPHWCQLFRRSLSDADTFLACPSYMPRPLDSAPAMLLPSSPNGGDGE
jgi:DNA-binding MarR family transcriptional regulator